MRAGFCGFGRGSWTWRESRQLAPKFEEFTVESVALLQAELRELFDLTAKLPLPPDRIDGQAGSG